MGASGDNNVWVRQSEIMMTIIEKINGVDHKTFHWFIFAVAIKEENIVEFQAKNLH